jgi:hypothetical protein
MMNLSPMIALIIVMYALQKVCAQLAPQLMESLIIWMVLAPVMLLISYFTKLKEIQKPAQVSKCEIICYSGCSLIPSCVKCTSETVCIECESTHYVDGGSCGERLVRELAYDLGSDDVNRLESNSISITPTGFFLFFMS